MESFESVRPSSLIKAVVTRAICVALPLILGACSINWSPFLRVYDQPYADTEEIALVVPKSVPADGTHVVGIRGNRGEVSNKILSPKNGWSYFVVPEGAYTFTLMHYDTSYGFVIGGLGTTTTFSDDISFPADLEGGNVYCYYNNGPEGAFVPKLEFLCTIADFRNKQPVVRGMPFDEALSRAYYIDSDGRLQGRFARESDLDNRQSP